MKINILTLVPEIFESFLQSDHVLKAKDICLVNVIDLKEKASGSFRHLDEKIYGGGRGMLVRCDLVLPQLKQFNGLKIALVPGVEPLKQSDLRRYLNEEEITLVCGHYEGLDQRIIDHCDEELSIGDYILSGGELASMVFIDALLRFLVVNEDCLNNESFEKEILECRQYTKPSEYEGEKVPEILMSGNHEAIRRWRKKDALRQTLKKRASLLENYELDNQERIFIKELEAEGD